MKKNSLLVLSILAMVAVLILSACSGGGSSSGGGNSVDVKVEMTEFAFNPSTINAPAGAKVNLTLTNSGSVQHSFVVMKKGTQVSGSFTDADKANIYFSQVVDAGKTVTASFTAPSDPGTYQVVCDIAGHFEAGMKADLVVK